MSGDVHVRFCESLGVQSPGATYPFVGVTGGSPGCTKDTIFAAVTESAGVFVRNDAGSWTSTGVNADISNAEDIFFAGGEFVAVGNSANVSTSEDAEFTLSGCGTNDDWDRKYNGPSDHQWFHAEERLGVRTVVGQQSLPGGVRQGKSAFNSATVNPGADPNWTPLLPDLNTEATNFVNGIAGGYNGWVMVGGTDSSQAIFFKACDTPMLIGPPTHTRKADEPAVFYFNGFDDTTTPVTYAVTAFDDTGPVTGFTFATDQRVLGDIGDSAVTPPAAFDGIVNVVDLGRLRAAFFAGSCDTDFNPEADLNSDDVVNVVDLGLLRQNFFASFSTATPQQLTGVIEWAPPSSLIGETVRFVITATNATGTAEKRFFVEVE